MGCDTAFRPRTPRLAWLSWLTAIAEITIENRSRHLKWHFQPERCVWRQENTPGFRGNSGASAGVPGLEPRTNDRRRGGGAHLHMGQNPAEFRGCHDLIHELRTETYWFHHLVLCSVRF